jgi:hypothetical protein
MTEPNKKLLDIQASKTGAQELIDIACPLIEEARNYATQSYVYNMASGYRTDEDTTVFLMFHHVLEMGDAIHILLLESCCEPAIPILRSLFESYLALEYIMASKDEKTYVNRIKSWKYVEAKKDIKRLEGYDPKHQEDPEFKKMLEEALREEGLEIDFTTAINERQKYVDSAEMRTIQTEYIRTLNKGWKPGKKRRKKCEWYGLFDGPSNLRELAKAIGQEGLHAFLYSGWSRMVHGGDHRRYIVREEPDGYEIRHLRTCDNLMQLARWTCVFLVRSIDLITRKFRPEEAAADQDYVRWYNKMRADIDNLR